MTGKHDSECRKEEMAHHEVLEVHHHYCHCHMPCCPHVHRMGTMGEMSFTEVAPSTCSGQLYTVQAGDTLTTIARRFSTTVSAIVAANPQITDPNVLVVGQVICIPGVTPPGPAPCQGIRHTIAAGDTLYALARRYGVSVQSILTANPGLDPNSLQVGRIICIPTTTPPPVTCPGFTYTIAPGDTFFALAQRYGTTVAELRRVNPGVDPTRLFVGQRICIPTPPPPSGCPGPTHTIAAGETLFGLAQRYGTTVQELLRLNPGLVPESLQVGRIICLPPSR